MFNSTAHSQVLHQDEKYVSRAMLSIQSVENGVTVKCLVHHPNLHLRPLMDFIQIQQSCEYSSVSLSELLSPAQIFSDHNFTRACVKFLVIGNRWKCPMCQAKLVTSSQIDFPFSLVNSLVSCKKKKWNNKNVQSWNCSDFHSDFIWNESCHFLFIIQTSSLSQQKSLAIQPGRQQLGLKGHPRWREQQPMY